MGFARQPLIDRIDEVDSEIPITFIYGAQSWMDPTMGYRTQVHCTVTSVRVQITELCDNLNFGFSFSRR